MCRWLSHADGNSELFKGEINELVSQTQVLLMCYSIIAVHRCNSEYWEK